MARRDSISNTAHPSSGCTSAFVVLFLGFFCVVGLAAGAFLSGIPIYRTMQARSWTATPCEVVSSQVVPNGDTYRADIQYRYRVGGRTYVSDRYSFAGWSTSNRSSPQAIVDRYPPGTAFECYVNPADATQAVVELGLAPQHFFGLIFVVFFTGIPGGILLAWLAFARKSKRASAALSGAPHPAAVMAAAAGSTYAASMGTDDRTTFGRPDTLDRSGPIVLEPTASPMTKLAIIVLVCLFWNGLTGLFTYFAISGFMSGGGEWFLVLFLIPFQLIGLGLIGGVFYQVLALANPRPTITLSSRTVPVGGSISFEWQLSGAVGRIRTLRLTLEGREEAKYRRGTDTYTDTNVFHKTTIVETSESMAIARGTATARIPRDTMHSFDAPNNKIVWTLKLHGDINRWPDVDESFDVTVKPA
jgi:Protein of unknown function (DUF3592)